MQSSIRRFLLGIASILTLVLTSQAATFTVTSPADDGSVGTLRWAINEAQSGPYFFTRDTIVFDLTPGSTITLTSPLNIDNCCAPGYTVIIGPGADDLTIDGNDNQMFTIKNGDLYNLTLTNGSSNSFPAGVNVVGGGSTILSGLKINNMSGSMGAVHMNSFGGTLDIYNCVVSGNYSSTNGAGIKHNTNGTVNIFNTTIAGNLTEFGGAGVMNGGGGTMNIRNSIIAQNVSANACCPQGNIREDSPITYGTNLVSNVTGSSLVADGILLGSPGMPVIPQFVTVPMSPPTSSGDFRLQAISPALNAGNNADIPPAPFDMTDLEGNARISETTVDLGAYEFLPPPMLTATKTDAELIGNGDIYADHGETYRYTLTISNAAMVQDAMMTLFSSGVDPNSTLIVGSVTTSSGTVTTGNTAGDMTVAVDIGSLASGSSVTITFDVQVDIQNPGTELSCQGSVSGSNFTTLVTDDPDTPDTDDATVTPLTPPDVSFTKTAMHIDANGDGIVNMGEIIQFTLIVSNAPNVSTALDVNVVSPIDPNTILSGWSTSQGTATPGVSDITAELGDINAGSSATLTLDFQVTFGAGGSVIECQAIASGSNFMDVLSDDPAEPGDADPTIIGIPTMGEWGIICLSLLLMIGGLLAFRRKENYAY